MFVKPKTKSLSFYQNIINDRVAVLIGRSYIMRGKKCNKLWLYFGIISGFLFGFCYFAYGVYTNVHNQRVGPYVSSQFHNYSPIHYDNISEQRK